MTQRYKPEEELSCVGFNLFLTKCFMYYSKLCHLHAVPNIPNLRSINYEWVLAINYWSAFNQHPSTSHNLLINLSASWIENHRKFIFCPKGHFHWINIWFGAWNKLWPVGVANPKTTCVTFNSQQINAMMLLLFHVKGMTLSWCLYILREVISIFSINKYFDVKYVGGLHDNCQRSTMTVVTHDSIVYCYWTLYMLLNDSISHIYV